MFWFFNSTKRVEKPGYITVFSDNNSIEETDFDV